MRTHSKSATRPRAVAHRQGSARGGAGSAAAERQQLPAWQSPRQQRASRPAPLRWTSASADSSQWSRRRLGESAQREALHALLEA
jgi:hypothetical protein